MVGATAATAPQFHTRAHPCHVEQLQVGRRGKRVRQAAAQAVGGGRQLVEARGAVEQAGGQGASEPTGRDHAAQLQHLQAAGLDQGADLAALAQLPAQHAAKQVELLQVGQRRQAGGRLVHVALQARTHGRLRAGQGCTLGSWRET